MLEIDILEGTRGTGKSTLAFKLRQKVSEVTLVNPTGLHEDGHEGLKKIHNYYQGWISLIHHMAHTDTKFIFDRFFFSEKVYSELYKDYSFEEAYLHFVDELIFLSSWVGVKINIFFLTIDDEKVLEKRLLRDKVPFGKAEESVKQSFLQQEHYRDMFSKLWAKIDGINNFNIHKIDTVNKDIDDIYEEVIQLKTAN